MFLEEGESDSLMVEVFEVELESFLHSIYKGKILKPSALLV